MTKILIPLTLLLLSTFLMGFAPSKFVQGYTFTYRGEWILNERLQPQFQQPKARLPWKNAISLKSVRWSGSTNKAISGRQCDCYTAVIKLEGGPELSVVRPIKSGSLFIRHQRNTYGLIQTVIGSCQLGRSVRVPRKFGETEKAWRQRAQRQALRKPHLLQATYFELNTRQMRRGSWTLPRFAAWSQLRYKNSSVKCYYGIPAYIAQKLAQKPLRVLGKPKNTKRPVSTAHLVVRSYIKSRLRYWVVKRTLRKRGKQRYGKHLMYKRWSSHLRKHKKIHCELNKSSQKLRVWWKNNTAPRVKVGTWVSRGCSTVKDRYFQVSCCFEKK